MPPLRLELTLETVTPLFLAGAAPRGAPELRPPSLRGALRYWLRAAVGGVVGGNVAEVRAAESAVFGSAADGSGSASAVTVRIPGPRALRSISYSNIAEGDGSRERPYQKPGSAYLLFAVRPTQQERERSGLQGTFRVALMSRPGAGNAAEAFTQAYASLWLLTHLGAVGNRSRRGAGALQAQALGQPAHVLPDMPALPVEATTPAALATEIGQGLTTIRQQLRQQLGNPTAPALPSVPKFDVLHPNACNIWVIDKTYQNWNDALDAVGRIYQTFRSRRDPDYTTVKSAMTGSGSLARPVERAAFGLPIPFYYRSLGGAQATLEAKNYDRRASPLWIRIVGLKENRYAVVLVWFQSQFLPQGQQLKLSPRRQPSMHGAVPNTSLLSTLLTGTDTVNHSSFRDKKLTLLAVTYA